MSEALAAETALKDSKRLQENQLSGEKAPLEHVSTAEKPTVNRRVDRSPKSYKPSNKRSTHSKPPGDSDCYRCGGKHQPSKCKFKEYECHFCKKKGHLASICRKKLAQGKTKPREQTNRINDEGTTDEDDQEYALYRVSSGSSKPILVPVTLDGVSMEMELDTGASVSLVSEEIFQQL